ncbi:MAG: hypothetical protein C4524_09880 [Candidatus Zixiibacteriota bacterium]|nr:MAG: hypothetical protein C4524_09880 [candidate division Zixibacteria bacterium]
MTRTTSWIVALLSMTLLALELTWTRIFSAEFFYTFAFLILSLSILGLGLGALALHLFPFLNRRPLLPLFLSLAGICALAGPPLVFSLGLRFQYLFSSAGMVGNLALAILILGSTYFFAGLALAMLFRNYASDLPRLYMADLLGAGVGVALAVGLMNALGTPAAAFLVTLPAVAAAFLAFPRWGRTVPALLAAVSVALALQAPDLLRAEQDDRAPVIYTHWDALAKVKIYDFAPDYRGLNIDNAANSPVYAFDGNWDRPDSLKYEFGIDVSHLIGRCDSCVFLSLGAGGGVDVLQALQAGATEVHAVDVVPHINWLMLEGDLADFSGRIYHDPRVEVVTEDARAYVRRFRDKFDVIYSLSSNTFAALASGSFALAENYLFTTEAFRDYWRALSPRGFLMMEHQFYMPRLVSEALAALESLGVADPRAHIAVYDLPKMRRKIILMSRQPLTEEIRYHALGPLTPERYRDLHLLYPAPDSLQGNLINRLVLEGWQAARDSSAINLSPCCDNRPFVAQLGLWKNIQWGKLGEVKKPYEFTGFPLSKLIIAIILLVVGALVLPLNLLPFLVKRDRLGPAPWLYFFTLGLAFMAVEVVLIQQFTLFIGPSAWSLVTILLILLAACGLGSRFAGRIPAAWAFSGIVIWLLLDALVMRHLFYALGGLTLAPRLLVSALLIAPLGFFMGMPFPLGGVKAGPRVAWGFAVNGAASVVGATAVVIVSFTWGFTAALLAAAGLYALAGVLLARGAWREITEEV